MDMTEEAKGVYGEILENSAIRGVFWMVIAEAPATDSVVGGTSYHWRNLTALCIADRSGYAQDQTGKIGVISANGWIIHE
jgi:hypothetical protein